MCVYDHISLSLNSDEQRRLLTAGRCGDGRGVLVLLVMRLRKSAGTMPHERTYDHAARARLD
jgi:hypothetical protein